MICQNWKDISLCISGHLISESYYKLKKNRLLNLNNIQNQEEEQPIRKILGNEYIELNINNHGSSFVVSLIYHIKKQELFVIKKPYGSQNILIDREIENYSKLVHPLIPKLIGKTEDKYPVIEFINGSTLNDFFKDDNNLLTDQEKITIVFEIMIIIEFCHRNHFIYRDLRPSNIMID